MRYSQRNALLFGLLLLFSVVFVIAVNMKFLEQEFQADICFDYDGGVNESIRSSIVFQNATDYGYITDFCRDSINLTEYACRTQQNSTQNLTFRQTWRVNCMNGCVNGTCQ